MTEYIDHRTGERMVQTTVYIEDWLHDWARLNGIKFGRALSTYLKLEKDKMDNSK
jgi:hypothetical protein